TCRATLVDLLAHKHAAKIVNFRGEAPKTPRLFFGYFCFTAGYKDEKIAVKVRNAKDQNSEFKVDSL
ncbi:MAG: hypothetical protein K5636_06450, partial [Bacteroidales bacterium]|nr:hypothetical protein [Bacteroidales bacterium]